LSRKKKEPSLFDSNEERLDRYDGHWIAGDSKQLIYHHKRYQKACDQYFDLNNQAMEKLEKGEMPSRWLRLKVWYNNWQYNHHRKAMNSNSRGLVSILYFLGYELLYLVILVSAYAALGAALLFGTPYLVEWLFHLP